uniref:Uncharacterized protein n=1 Tax=Dunaliella tertiolecta TaxID=3047 RepID=A0A7S3R892_DUNTE
MTGGSSANPCHSTLHAYRSAGLSLIPKDIGLTDVDHGLVGLGKDFARVADTDMDLMFQKARAEERAGRQHVFAQQPPSLNSGTATSVAPPPSTVSLAAGQGASNMGGTSGCAVSSMGQGASSMGQGHAVNGIGQGASSMGSTSGHAGPSQGGTGWAGTAPAGTQPWQAPVQRRSSSSSLTGYVRNKQQQQQQQQQQHSIIRTGEACTWRPRCSLQTGHGRLGPVNVWAA